MTTYRTACGTHLGMRCIIWTRARNPRGDERTERRRTRERAATARYRARFAAKGR